MIRNIIKKNIVLIVSILTITSINAQSKYGADENACKENLSLFFEYVNQKNYADALRSWRWTFNNCPESSRNIYKKGPKIIKERMKVDKENKSAYIDTLMMVFDQRIQYFGQEGYVLGLKGYELINLDKKRSKEGLEYTRRSLDLDGNKASAYAAYAYFKSTVNLEKTGTKTKADVLEAYAIVSEIINYNIVNKSKTTNLFITQAAKVEDLFTPYANCDDLITLFTSKIETNTENIDFFKKVINVLNNKNCSDSELFFNASSKLYDLEPSAAAADQMSKMSIVKGKPSDAIFYAKEAIKIEEDTNTKAKYYLALADAYRAANSFISARKAVYSALELRKDWGEAYMNLGNIYIAGASSCGNNFEQKTVYWIAVDNFQKALNDEDTKERASRSINMYSRYFPTSTLCFEYSPLYNKRNGLPDKHVIITGDKYNLDCWINKSTTVRTSNEIE